MADLNLTQAEADTLIAIEKHRTDDDRYDFPLGGSLSLLLQSPDKREHFMLDISRSRIDLLKGKYQNRARQVVVLVRLDFGGSLHRNPDGVEIPCPHLHIYREGFGDKWAISPPADKFHNVSNLWQGLEDFMRYCNITQPPFIERGMFS
jgi:MoaA/NifB/PqqE/SkfB family radical SAM enzyme